MSALSDLNMVVVSWNYGQSVYNCVVVRSNMNEEKIEIKWLSLTVLEFCFGFDMEVVVSLTLRLPTV
jgi:hypothetical protein